MKGNEVPKKKKSVLAFILGFLFGVIVLAASLFGVTFFALTSDLDAIFNMTGIDNGSDEEGHVYINTDENNGGVKNLLQLMSVFYSWASDYGNLTIGQIDNIVPASRGIVEQVKGSMSRFVDVDDNRLRSTRFADFGAFMKDLIMDVRTADVIDAYGMKDTMNKMLEIILYGIEANYVTAPDGTIYPLYVDNYHFNEETGEYLREEDAKPLDPSQYGYLQQQTSDKNTYDLFFYSYDYPGEENVHFIAERNPDDVTLFDFTATPEKYASHRYDYAYSTDYAETTGNFYYDNNNNQIFIEPVTIGSLVSGEGMGVLDKVLVIEIIDDNPGAAEPSDPENPDAPPQSGTDSDLMKEILGDVTVGDLMYGRVDFNDRINTLKLSSVIKIDPRSNAILAYIGYGLTDMAKEPAEDGTYSAVYNALTGEKINVKVTMDGDAVKSILPAEGEGEPLSGTLISEVSARVDGVTHDLKIGALMEIEENNTIMNAIKNSTVDSLPDDIAALSVNELYAESIYGYDVTEVDEEGTETVTHHPAVLKEAVLNAEAVQNPEEQIVFDKSYLYYEEHEDGSKKLVNLANDGEEEGPGATDNGKLTEEQFEAGIAEGKKYYTYGAPNKLWKLLVLKRVTEMRQVMGDDGLPKTDEETGAPVYEEVYLYSTEVAYSVNGITNMVDNVTDNIRGTSLSDLNEAGILKMQGEDLKILIKGAETPEDPADDVHLGDLPLEDALGELITLLHMTETP